MERRRTWLYREEGQTMTGYGVLLSVTVSSSTAAGQSGPTLAVRFGRDH